MIGAMILDISRASCLPTIRTVAKRRHRRSGRGATFREKATAETPAQPIPSSVLCLRQRFVLRRDIDQTTYLAYEFQSDALLFFLSTLLHRIGMVKTAVPNLFSDYAWMRGIMTEYDENGKAVPIIGIGVGRFGRSTSVKRS